MSTIPFKGGQFVESTLLCKALMSAVFLFANSLNHLLKIGLKCQIYYRNVSLYLRIQFSRSEIAGRIYLEKRCLPVIIFNHSKFWTVIGLQGRSVVILPKLDFAHRRFKIHHKIRAFLFVFCELEIYFLRSEKKRIEFDCFLVKNKRVLHETLQ